MSSDIMTRVREIGRQLEVMKWGEGMGYFMNEEDAHEWLKGVFGGSGLELVDGGFNAYADDSGRIIEMDADYRVTPGAHGLAAGMWRRWDAEDGVIARCRERFGFATVRHLWQANREFDYPYILLQVPEQPTDWQPRQAHPSHRAGQRCHGKCSLCEALERGDG